MGYPRVLRSYPIRNPNSAIRTPPQLPLRDNAVTMARVPGSVRKLCFAPHPGPLPQGERGLSMPLLRRFLSFLTKPTTTLFNFGLRETAEHIRSVPAAVVSSAALIGAVV